MSLWLTASVVPEPSGVEVAPLPVHMKVLIVAVRALVVVGPVRLQLVVRAEQTRQRSLNRAVADHCIERGDRAEEILLAHDLGMRRVRVASEQLVARVVVGVRLPARIAPLGVSPMAQRTTRL